MSTAESRAKRAVLNKQANGRASGPVLMPGFLVVLDHSAKPKKRNQICGDDEERLSLKGN